MTLSLPLAALALAAGVLIASCHDNGTITNSGIEGRVTVGPMCPVERVDTPCPDQPYQATIVVLDANAHNVKSFESAADGSFRVALAPGHYTLDPQPANGSPLPAAAPQDVDVRSGAYTHVDVQYDSGIR
jgi:hypothetical protein